MAGLRGFEPPNVRLTKCLAHRQNLAALPKLFEARSEIAFCEFESSHPSQPPRSPTTIHARQNGFPISYAASVGLMRAWIAIRSGRPLGCARLYDAALCDGRSAYLSRRSTHSCTLEMLAAQQSEPSRTNELPMSAGRSRQSKESGLNSRSIPNIPMVTKCPLPAIGAQTGRGENNTRRGSRFQRTAMGETVEPVAPRILSGVMIKANSCTFLLRSSSSLRFSRRCTPFTTSAIWWTGSEISGSGLGATSTGQLSEPSSTGFCEMSHSAAFTPMPGHDFTKRALSLP